MSRWDDVVAFMVGPGALLDFGDNRVMIAGVFGEAIGFDAGIFDARGFNGMYEDVIDALTGVLG